MESRKIYIVDAQRNKHVINSSAKTLGELKYDLNESGINFEDMSIYEGFSATELVSNESQLPTQVAKSDGTRTNELLIMITNSHKKTTSGSLRSDLYDYIIHNELKDEVKKEFGRNFTQVSNEDLDTFVRNHFHSDDCDYEENSNVLTRLISILLQKGIINNNDISNIYATDYNDMPVGFPSSDEIENAFNKIYQQ